MAVDAFRRFLSSIEYVISALLASCALAFVDATCREGDFCCWTDPVLDYFGIRFVGCRKRQTTTTKTMRNQRSLYGLYALPQMIDLNH